MTARWDKAAHAAELEALDTDALIERLKGKYPGAVYAPNPLTAEAAKRLEQMRDRIVALECGL